MDLDSLAFKLVTHLVMKIGACPDPCIRITANKVAPLTQSETRFIYRNFFTIKAPLN